MSLPSPTSKSAIESGADGVGINGCPITDRLVRAGMSETEARVKSGLFAKASKELVDAFGSSASSSYHVFVPGRIEVLGKHTDYAGGRSLLATVERGFCFVAKPRSDDVVSILDATGGERTTFRIAAELVPTAGHWSNYPMTVARRLARNFPGNLRGADIALLSDLPPAAGMSSSSALIIGMFKVLAHVNDLAVREEYRCHFDTCEALAGYLATIENGKNFGSLLGDRGVGTFGGSEDHTAICCCRPGQFHLYSFCPVRLEKTIAVPADFVFVIGSSGVLAEKTGEAMEKYNRASRLVSALLEISQADTGRADCCLADAVRSSSDAPDRLRKRIASHGHSSFESDALGRRLEQFLRESEEIIPAAADALSRNDIATFGRCVDQSQHLTESLLRNQVPQTVCLARMARQCGAVAASAFGAGFGGSVWAMIDSRSAASFLATWEQVYREHFPDGSRRSAFFITRAGPGLIELQRGG